MTDTELIQYYADLLILQYKTQSKAPEHIKALIETIMIFELIQDVKNGYDIETAVGVQLDVLGKYIGLERDAFLATDADYRFYLKFRIIQNFSNYSVKEIDDLLFEFFGTNIIMTDNLDMTMRYEFLNPDVDQVNFLVNNNLLPKPAAVGIEANIGHSANPFVFSPNPIGGGYNYLTTAPIALNVDFGSGTEDLEVDFGSGIVDLEVVFDLNPTPANGGGEYSYLIGV